MGIIVFYCVSVRAVTLSVCVCLCVCHPARHPLVKLLCKHCRAQLPGCYNRHYQLIWLRVLNLVLHRKWPNTRLLLLLMFARARERASKRTAAFTVRTSKHLRNVAQPLEVPFIVNYLHFTLWIGGCAMLLYFHFPRNAFAIFSLFVSSLLRGREELPRVACIVFTIDFNLTLFSLCFSAWLVSIVFNFFSFHSFISYAAAAATAQKTMYSLLHAQWMALRFIQVIVVIIVICSLVSLRVSTEKWPNRVLRKFLVRYAQKWNQ